MRHILNPKNSQPLDKNLNLAMPTFGPTNREYYIIDNKKKNKMYLIAIFKKKGKYCSEGISELSLEKYPFVIKVERYESGNRNYGNTYEIYSKKGLFGFHINNWHTSGIIKDNNTSWFGGSISKFELTDPENNTRILHVNEIYENVSSVNQITEVADLIEKYFNNINSWEEFDKSFSKEITLEEQLNILSIENKKLLRTIDKIK